LSAPSRILRDRRFVFFALLVVMLVIDQVTKFWTRANIVEAQSLGIPWPGVFELTLTYNKGIAFGMLQGAGVLMAPIAIAIAVGAAWYSLRHPRESRTTHVALGLLASGALGNLYDRLVLGQVTDMFWLRLGNITRDWPFTLRDFPVFNVADMCITVAGALLVLTWAADARSAKETAAPAEDRKEGPEEPQEESHEETGTAETPRSSERY
jgi:signal peptidase II